MSEPTAGADRPLRVRLVTPGFPPDRGGVEEHCHQLAAQLSALGDDVSVLTASRSGPSGWTRRPDGVDVRTYPAWRTTAMSIAPRLAAAGLADPSGDSDIAHVHSYHATSGFVSLAGRRRPLVFTPHYHGSGHSRLARGLHVGYRLIGRSMFAAADAVICVSEAERIAVVRDFPSVADRITVIPNGVDRAAIRAAGSFPDEPPTALVVGRLESYKHVELAIRAMAAVPEPAQLVVIGTGSQANALQRLAEELGLGGRVRLLGGVATDELHRWMRTARVLVSLSEHEAFGMVPLEAATAGARVVLSDIPAHREITASWLGGRAQLVSAADDPMVSEAITRALTDSDRTPIDVPDWSEIAAATRAVYLDVLRARTSSQPPDSPAHVRTGSTK